ncbi:MAG TPA: hypothetical protein VH138_13830, partial [Vicinamibacterales bacterium]|nr:hypothetical protein [Vicinamibacterales bacterium]
MVDEPSRLEREVRLHKRLRELLLQFSSGLSTNLGLPAALERLTPEIRDLAAARAVEIWLHDRRKGELYQAATSQSRTSTARVSVNDSGHYAASGLRLDRPRFAGPYLLVPLRGWRRALGTLVIERSERVAGPSHTPPRRGAQGGDFDDAEFLEFGRELARQLSVGIENVLLLDDVLRQNVLD